MYTKIPREQREHSSKLVPFSYYKSKIPEFFANVPLHWHAEFEMNCISHGYGKFICGDDKFTA